MTSSRSVNNRYGGRDRTPATAAEKGLPGADDTSARPALTIDWDLYAEHLEGSDLSDDQKREFLEALWAIIVAFVDLGFGVHPLQQASDACGQIGDIGDLSGKDAAELVDYGSGTNRQFENAAEGVAARREERSPE